MNLNFHVFKMVSILRWEKKKEKVIAQLSSLFPLFKLLPFFHVLIFKYKKSQFFYYYMKAMWLFMLPEKSWEHYY